MKRKEMIWIGALLGWMIFIFYMSNQPAEVSSAQSNLVLKIIESLGINIDGTYIDIVITIIRKSAHIIEYAILAILAVNTFSFHCGRKQAVIIGLSLTIGYAIIDEIHQLFIVGRAGRMLDVIIDSIGGIIGIGLVMAKKIIKCKSKKKISIN
ncbi:MAG: VanZ family protein [Clostridium sp.]|uniref:VanZ family protein n=1 Tax=Clostridium sp. TaxID=1506 RepID=UPI003EE6A3A2